MQTVADILSSGPALKHVPLEQAHAGRTGMTTSVGTPTQETFASVLREITHSEQEESQKEPLEFSENNDLDFSQKIKGASFDTSDDASDFGTQEMVEGKTDPAIPSQPLRFDEVTRSDKLISVVSSELSKAEMKGILQPPTDLGAGIQVEETKEVWNTNKDALIEMVDPSDPLPLVMENATSNLSTKTDIAPQMADLTKHVGTRETEVAIVAPMKREVSNRSNALPPTNEQFQSAAELHAAPFAFSTKQNGLAETVAGQPKATGLGFRETPDLLTTHEMRQPKHHDSSATPVVAASGLAMERPATSIAAAQQATVPVFSTLTTSEMAEAVQPVIDIRTEPDLTVTGVSATGATPSNSTPFQTTTTATHPALSPHNSVEIAKAAFRLRDAGGSVEVQLTPEDLGRLTIKIDNTSHVPQVTFWADKLETFDVMRRHLDLIEKQFENMGLGDMSLTFGDRPRDPQDDDHNATQFDSILDSSSENEVTGIIEYSAASSGLDIRI